MSRPGSERPGNFAKVRDMNAIIRPAKAMDQGALRDLYRHLNPAQTAAQRPWPDHIFDECKRATGPRDAALSFFGESGQGREKVFY
jgi:hypothetical protein